MPIWKPHWDVILPMKSSYPESTRYLQEKYREIISGQEEIFAAEYQKELMAKMKESTAKYKGEHVPFLYNPFIISLEDWNYLKGLMEKFNKILEKVIEQYLSSSRFRSFFPFDSRMEEHILVDPGYESYYPIARFDLFWQDGEELKFCEINTDGTSAMNEVRVIQEIVCQGRAVRKLQAREDIALGGFELFESWIDRLEAIYREFSGQKKKKPVTAIMDFEGEGVLSEFSEYQGFMEKRGWEVYITDPREFEYRNDKLYYKDRVIDLIYRRATTQRLFAEQEEIEDLLQAYREGAVCICGSFRSQIIHNKALFKILTDPEKLNFLTAEERDFLQRHIPETDFVLPDERTLTEITERQQELIVKPCDLNACQGVRTGQDLSREEWQSCLREIAGVRGENYLFQKYCNPPELDLFLVSEEEPPGFKEFNYIIGLFLYDQKLQGIYNRAGRKNIIGAVAECYTTPVYLSAARREREKLESQSGVIVYE